MILNFSQFISERKDTPKPKGAPDWHDSDAPDAEGRFRDLSPKDLAAWLIKTRKGDMKRISGSITQQIVFNRKKDPEYAKKMEKTRIEVYKQLGREDLLEESKMTANNMVQYIKDLTPSDSDHPDYFLSLIKKSGKNFELKNLKIADILKMDKSLNDYVKSGEIRYGEGGESDLQPYDDELDQPIVIFNDEVVDGYSRTSTLHKRGVKTISAWVSESETMKSENISEEEVNEITLAYAGAKEILKDLKEDPDLLSHLGFGSFKDAVRYIKDVGMDLWYELRGEIEDYKKLKK